MSGGTNQYRHRMRCNRVKCKHRFTLKKTPIGLIDCPVCGSGTHSCENQRQREMKKQITCDCSAIPFKHRQGSILGCVSHPIHPDDWTTEQEYQYLGMQAVPRSG